MHADPAVHKWVRKLIYATFCEHDWGSRIVSSMGPEISRGIYFRFLFHHCDRFDVPTTATECS